MSALLRSGLILVFAVAVLGTPRYSAAQSCPELCAGNIGVGGDVSGYDNCMSRCGNQGSRAAPPGIAPPDPCYIAQNAMRPCKPALKGVDPNVVGTWTLPVKDGLWIWEIFSNGTYKFHSEAKDGAPDHSGTFSANHGDWTLKATKGIKGYADNGTYKYQPPDTLIATGKLGPGAWRRSVKPDATTQPAK